MAEAYGHAKCPAATTRSKKGGNGFSRKCAALVKEQRARIYILRRCATMLLCCRYTVETAGSVWFYGFVVPYLSCSFFFDLIDPRDSVWFLGMREVCGHTV
ncbi:hypothetical protein CKAN_00542200 [Cinnamomum micranthum f. kanehirae]|uniref:Uncharacterized protein n=1 Tax=Cinnamomum micranthum f. kanehirae TaxID=337451 RepID=A0A443NEN0_9MAGN|nr:hypothetical protein CKAN_00542200 [Cinnamomum micranthum f. kanehirae]